MNELDVPRTLEGLKDHVGRPLPSIDLPDAISSSDVRRFLLATGDHNPLWRDDAYARDAGYRERIVPPIFVTQLLWRLLQIGKRADTIWADIPPPAPYLQMRNASTETEWFEPVYLGDRITIQETLRDASAHEGRSSRGIHVEYDARYTNQHNQTAAVLKQTAIWIAGDGA